jgi:hypothetical protein
MVNDFVYNMVNDFVYNIYVMGRISYFIFITIYNSSYNMKHISMFWKNELDE